MEPGKKHLYKVRLETNQFASVNIIQKGIDVKVLTYDLKGNKLCEFDSPNGNNGPENAALTSIAKGDYLVEVESQWASGKSPNYEITLDVVRQKATSLTGQIDEIMAPFDSKKSPGASIAIVKGGQVIFEKGYGMANLEHGIPLTPSTPEQIGSITKSFTNYCMLVLEKEGKLSYDDDIHKYIPELPDFGHKMTLRQISQHSSGLRDYASLRGMARYEIDTWEMFFKMISRMHDLNFVPGEDCMYSNTGCTLFAEIIQRLSGQSYASFVKEHIFDPLGMHSSSIQTSQSQLIPGIADSYDRTADGPKKMYVLGDLYGGTGLISNARDMALWASHLLHPKFNADIVRTMATPGKLNNGTETTFGSGLMISDYRGHLELGHSGSVGGFKTHVGVFPDEDLAVVYLANNNDVDSRPLARKIAALYFKHEGKTNAATHLVSVAPAKPKQFQPIDKSQIDLSEYTGTFFSDEIPTTYWLKIIDGQLTVQPSYASDLKLTPESKDIFTGAYEGIIEFVRDSEGNINGCKFSFPRMKNLYCKKIAN